jgi:hypothetical protein
VHPEVAELYVLCGGISRLSAALQSLLPKPQAALKQASQRTTRHTGGVAFAGATEVPR